MKKILWLNRHNPRKDQVSDLNRIFGEVELVQRIERIIPFPLEGVAQIIELMKEEKADEIICSVPIQHLEGLVEKGIKPIRAIMQRTPTTRLDGNQEREFDFQFIHFERIVEVKYKAEKL